MMKIYLFALCCLLCLPACNSKKAETTEAAPENTENTENTEEPAPQAAYTEKADTLAEYVYSNYYRVDDLFDQSTPFAPAKEETDMMKTPADGSYAVLRMNVNYTAGIHSRIVSYVKSDSSDMRLFWMNYDAGNTPLYAKEISQLAGDNRYDFSFNAKSRIMKLQYEQKEGFSDYKYYKLGDDARFHQLPTPVLYQVKEDKVMNCSLRGGTELTVFSPDCDSRGAEDCSFVATLKASAPPHKEIYEHSVAEDGRLYLAIEGAKRYACQPDLQEVPETQERLDWLRQRLIDQYMKDDATAAFISDEVVAHKIPFGDNTYQVYTIDSSFRYGSYKWFFAAVDEDLDNLYYIGSVPGTILGGIKVFALDEHLFLYMRNEWYTADSELYTGVQMSYLSPEICFDLSMLGLMQEKNSDSGEEEEVVEYDDSDRYAY
ncbi:hypothetical protein [Dysgonomonas sp. 25]|uniref:hypothetical protein n=1 Tax=Dysgonomonas sp. 25 TaxID=2302933 RepID=UPI0013D0CADC|nr:hypothetical protein [Dysgonomonas sp. 25]NDV69205.1 hypothetical protein [Dysgonomonas sp. 25]